MPQGMLNLYPLDGSAQYPSVEARPQQRYIGTQGAGPATRLGEILKKGGTLEAPIAGDRGGFKRLNATSASSLALEQPQLI